MCDPTRVRIRIRIRLTCGCEIVRSDPAPGEIRCGYHGTVQLAVSVTEYEWRGMRRVDRERE